MALDNKTDALKAALKLIIDAGKDVAAHGDAASYSNLIGDVVALMPLVGEIPSEAKALIAADYLELVNALVADLAVTNVKAEGIINAALKILSDLFADVPALIVALKA